MVELLVVMVILPLVIGAIAAVVLVGFTDTAGVSSRLSDSHDAQITSAYFVRDIESATKVSTATAPGYAVCPATATGTQLLGLTWTPPEQKPVAVSYGLAGTNPSTLVRRFCQGGRESDSTVSHDVFQGLAPASVSNTCPGSNSSCASSGATPDATATVQCLNDTTSCANAGLIPTYPVLDRDGNPLSADPGISSIVLTVTENQTNYQYSLSASPRNQATQSLQQPLPPGVSAPSLLLLGSGTGVLSCSGSVHDSPITVNGTAAVNSSSPGSVQLGSHNDLSAGQLYTQDTSGDSVNRPSNYMGTYASGPSYPDPFANLPDPSTDGVPIRSSTNSLAAGPGVYRNAVTITSPETISGGTYIFEHGLSISGNGNTPTTLSGNNVFFFIGIPNAGPGVTQDAAYTVSGNAGIDITADTSPSDIYQGIVIFQSRYDSRPLTVSGNGVSSTYGGVIYAPDAPVETSGNGATFAGSIVASSLACGGNGGISIGFAGTQTTPTSSSVLLGTTNTDEANVIGNPFRGAPTGTVSFYICPPVGNVPAPCTSKTTPVGSPVTLTPGANDTSTATSPALPAGTLTTTGVWCFAGYYSGDSNYGATADTSTGECFTVMKPLVNFSFPANGQSFSQSEGTWSSTDSCATAEAICGTASDSGATVTDLSIAIEAPNSRWWDGTTTNGVANYTQTGPDFIDIAANAAPALPSASSAWTEGWASADFPTAGTYVIEVMATDSLNDTSVQTSTITMTP